MPLKHPSRAWPLVALLTAALAGCTAPVELDGPAPTGQALASAGMEPPGNTPIVGRLIVPQGPPEPGSVVELRWIVEQRGSLGVPLHVSVRAPDGAQVSGDVEAHLEPQLGVREGTIRVSFDAVPQEDLVVVVHGRAAHAGYHQELAYRFGRAAPAVHEPTRTPMPLRVGGRELGRAVVADPPPQ